MKFNHAPSGKIITGHVLDVAVAPLERALKDYDKLLYVKWNPRKMRGWGMWEIRRRPENKSIVDVAEFKGMSIVRLEYDELEIINHVLDVPYLNYDVITKLQAMDRWNDKYWAANLDYNEAVHRDEGERKNRKELIYGMKQYKKEIREFKEAVLSGHNPAEIAKAWNKIGS
jgi:hypothetical protein